LLWFLRPSQPSTAMPAVASRLGSDGKDDHTSCLPLKGVALERLAHLVRHVGRPTSSKPQALTAAVASSLPRNFRKGLLAHLILVPSWTVSPALLLAGVIVAGAPLGRRGVAGGLALGAGLVVAPSNAMRALACMALAGLAAAAPRKRMQALFGAAVSSFLTWMISVGGSFGQHPGIVDYLCRWASHFYAKTELKGALDDLRPTKSFYSFHPHGCLSAGWTINGTFNPKFAQHAGKVNWLIDPNLRHKNPSFRLLCESYNNESRAIGAGNAAGFKQLMSRGESVAFIPGGFQDAVVHQYGKDRTVVQRRKGFIKYCLQYGYRLHPVYTFGESETYYTFAGLQSFRLAVAENNIPMVMFFGWPWLPILPRPQSQILTYVGKGIDLPCIPEPTAADVEHWHGVYIEALRAVFYDNRKDAGYESSELEIL